MHNFKVLVIAIYIPEWSLEAAGQLDGLGGMSVQQVKMVELRERGGVLDTSGCHSIIKVTKGLHSIQRGAQVGIDGESPTGRVGFLKLEVFAATSWFD